MENKNLTKKRLLALALSLSMVSGYMAPLHAQDDGDDSYRGVQTFSSGGFDMGSDGGGVGGGSVDMEGSDGGGGNLFGGYTGSSQADMNAMMNSAPPPDLVNSNNNSDNSNSDQYNAYGLTGINSDSTNVNSQPLLQSAQNGHGVSGSWCPQGQEYIGPQSGCVQMQIAGVPNAESAMAATAAAGLEAVQAAQTSGLALSDVEQEVINAGGTAIQAAMSLSRYLVSEGQVVYGRVGTYVFTRGH